MRFARSSNELPLIVDTLRQLAGPGAPRANWADWVEFVGRRPDLKPPPGYAGWKGVLHSAIDPRFAGELAYWFGWFAFFPKTELYGGAPAR